MIPPLTFRRRTDHARLAATVGRWLSPRTEGVRLGDEATGLVSDTLAGATSLDSLRGSYTAPARFLAMADALDRAVTTTTDTTFGEADRPARARVLRAAAALGRLAATSGGDPRPLVVAVVEAATEGDDAHARDAAARDLVGRLVAARLVEADAA